MAIFFIKFKVTPTEHNPQSALVMGARAHCWVVERSEQAAHSKARFYVLQGEWQIVSMEADPIQVTEADFESKDIMLKQYFEALDKGIALLYEGWARDGKTSMDPHPAEQPPKFDLNSYVGKQKKLSQRRRCLHFNRGVGCEELIVSAHSIQKNGQLSMISNDGLVYAISKNIGTMKKNKGQPTFEKQGIGKVSTFYGFCGKHDNELFAPIDRSPLVPTNEQVFLYAYRSICRELFVKENALDLFNSQIAKLPTSSTRRQLFEELKTGTSFGFSNLLRHKIAFDGSLSDGCYEDIEYVLFTSKQSQFLAFSGLFYPDFDFLAQKLQDLRDHRSQLDLLVFCSAPMGDGWGFLFAWHKTSSKTCTAIMHSLATVMYEDASGGADAMFRLAINCENLAISPVWWEALAPDNRAAVMAQFSHGADIFTPTDPEYLARGLKGVCQWEFDGMYTSAELLG